MELRDVIGISESRKPTTGPMDDRSPRSGNLARYSTLTNTPLASRVLKPENRDLQEFVAIHVQVQHGLPLFPLIAADVYVSGFDSR